MTNIFIDTNIWIDIIGKRQPFVTASFEALAALFTAGYQPVTSASSITDIYYVCAEKMKLPEEKVKTAINSLILPHIVASTTAVHVRSALSSSLKDFEDALQVAIAIDNDCRYILTRNTNDFLRSAVLPIEPEAIGKII